MILINLFLLFCAGIFFHMSIKHYFCFSETIDDPLIRMWKYRYIACTIWATVQLAAGLLIIFFLNYQFEPSIESLFLFIGFSSWGILRGIIMEKKANETKT